MKNDIPCSLVQDLLALYNDLATSGESNGLIEEHLKHCDTCSRFLDEIRENKNSLLDAETQRYVQIGEKIRKRKRLTRIAVAALFVLAIVLVYAIFCPVLISGSCMAPAVADGKIVFLNRMAYTVAAPQKFDVVAYQREGRVEIGRIIAGAGDVIEIKDEHLYVNGEDRGKNRLVPGELSEHDMIMTADTYLIGKDHPEEADSQVQQIHRAKLIGKFHIKE